MDDAYWRSATEDEAMQEEHRFLWRALHSSGFHPALAHEAVRWARERGIELDDAPDPAA